VIGSPTWSQSDPKLPSAPYFCCDAQLSASDVIGCDPWPNGGSPCNGREFLTLLGGAAAAWPHEVQAQQPQMAVVGLVNGGSMEASGALLGAFRKGLNATGYVEGQNVIVEYHFVENRYEELPSLMADLVRRRVSVIVAPSTAVAALAAKAATYPDRIRSRKRPGQARSGEQSCPAGWQRDRHQLFQLRSCG
jgi:hypothetical protein